LADRPQRRWLFTVVRIVVATALACGFLASLLAIVLTGPIIGRSQRFDVAVDASPQRLERDVRLLSEEFVPRDFEHRENLDRAADWIADELEQTGLDVSFQDYTIEGARYRNVVASRAGWVAGAGAIVVGAHYDAYDEFPGANDNASGVAVLLELARTLPTARMRGPLYLVAFSTEEPPYFRSENMGSSIFARDLIVQEIDVDLMIALDVVGYYSNEKNSQDFPALAPLMRLLYSDTGNFVTVVGDLGSGKAIKRVKIGMLSTRALPVESFRAPASVPGVDYSDHLSFRRLGQPAVLITDTAFMRYPQYHTAEDTAEKLDYERMASLVQALHGVLRGHVLPGQ